MMVGTEDKFLLDLVASGRTLQTMARKIGRHPKTVLKRLKFLGVAHKDLQVEDCYDPTFGTHIKRAMEIFTYEVFLEKLVKEKTPVARIAKQLNVDRDEVRYAIKKYKNRYYQETGVTL